jgi:AcrR family transcriptional regulator
MTTNAPAEAGVRPPLSRQQILRAALAYVDELGLDALSMHKLGARLGVQAMSLYNHVDDKADLLNGLVELLWSEMAPTEGVGDWRQRLRAMANGIRETMRAHPAAASLLMTRPVLPVGALRIFKAHLDALQGAGFARARAVQMVRAIAGYAFGAALCECCWSCPAPAAASELARLRQVSRMLPADVPDELLQVAMEVCGECDLDGSFELGLELMVKGLEAG